MLKKITWQDGTILSLKLRDDLYTLVQMREDYYLEFFDIKNSRDEWSDIDLGKTDILFFNFTATKALKTLAISAPPLEKVAADNRRPQRILLRAIIGGNYGADLIELTDSLEDFDATVLKSNLTLENDLETIYRYELSGIIGDPEKLRNRLINYFDNGVNWDEAKAFLFKGISPPPAKKEQAMKKPALMKYKQNNLTLEGDELTLAQIKPALNNLIQNLIALPDTSDQNSILEVFKNSILSINDSELEIETVERESLLDAIYSIGEIVGLDPQTEFAEEWRGDW